MIRKIFTLVLTGMLLLFVSACGDSGESRSSGSKTQGVDDVLESGAASADQDETGRQSGVSENAPEPEEVADDAVLSNTEGIDIDLTTLSSTMVYSEVYNMMNVPEDYIGKTVKMEGSFAYYHDEANDQYYFACVISDAAACCAQGMEFVLEGDYTFPEDYPEEGETIRVAGEFDTYYEGQYQYCTLRNASFV